MARNDLWRDIRAAEHAGAASLLALIERELVSRSQVTQHPLSNSYVPQSAEGRHEELLWCPPYTGGGDDADEYNPFLMEGPFTCELSDTLATIEMLVSAGEVVPEEMQSAFEAYDEPFAEYPTDPYAYQFAEWAKCTRCGEAGMEFVRHITCGGIFTR